MAEGRCAAPLILYTEHARANFHHGANISADEQKVVSYGHNLRGTLILLHKSKRMKIQSRFDEYGISMKNQRQGRRGENGQGGDRRQVHD